MRTGKILHGRVLENLFLISLFILSYNSPCKIWNFPPPISPYFKEYWEKASTLPESENCVLQEESRKSWPFKFSVCFADTLTDALT